MLTISILIALAVNGLIMNPGYQWLINRLNLDFKPFNCVYCLAFWIGFIVAVLGFNPLSVAIPLAASFLAVAFNRWFDNQPVKFK